MSWITTQIGNLIYICYQITNNYGLSILLFTLVIKIILFPLSIVIHKNSIKMVKMYPEINKIKTKYFKNSEEISEKQYQLYKKEKYHPLFDIIPIVLQIIILIGITKAMQQPLTYIFDNNSTQEFIVSKNNFTELQIIEAMKNNSVYIMNNINTNRFGFNFYESHNYFVAIITSLSALFLCFIQNRYNVLQKEQNKINKYSTTIFSTGLSLYLGFFVPIGIAFYWLFSNLFAIVQIFILNYWINPKNKIDYMELENSKKQLEKTKQKYKINHTKEIKAKEKEDYKNFFKEKDKKIVFYSENNGFYKYFQNIIEYLLKNSDITIYYVTSDYYDTIFKNKNDRIKSYYIGNMKLIPFMMKMDADIVIMTMPELELYQIKRSYVRKDIKYIYIPHGLGSDNVLLKEKALNYFDIIFTPNKYYKQEQTEINQYYQLKREFVDFGYSVIDNIIKEYKEKETNIILIAPSWQEDNLMNYIYDIINSLLKTEETIILRPHPQHIRHNLDQIEELKEYYKDNKRVIIETNFLANETIYNADYLITDWSSIAYEYSLGTLKPTIFVNTKPKILNKNYKAISSEPTVFTLRNKIGIEIEKEEIKNLDKKIKNLDKKGKKEQIKKLREEYLYNINQSGEKGGQYIIQLLEKGH